MKKESVGVLYIGGIIKKEVSLSRSQSDICQRNRPPPGDDVLRPTVSTNELGKIKVCAFMHLFFKINIAGIAVLLIYCMVSGN